MRELLTYAIKQPHIAQLMIYPVKSLRGVACPEVLITENGLATPNGPAADRMFAMACGAPDSNGVWPGLTLRKCPQLAGIGTRITEAGVELNAKGMGSWVLPYGVENGEPLSVSAWNGSAKGSLRGVRVDPDADRWLASALGIKEDVRILAVPDGNRRALDESYQQPGVPAFSGRGTDGHPLHVAALQSVRKLNKVRRQMQPSLPPVSMRRFRANVILGGSISWDEGWPSTLLFDDEHPTQIVNLRACSRCVTINADPQTGQRQSDVLRSLANMQSNSGELAFGIWAAPTTESVGQTLRLGQLLKVEIS